MKLYLIQISALQIILYKVCISLMRQSVLPLYYNYIQNILTTNRLLDKYTVGYGIFYSASFFSTAAIIVSSALILA